uniref:HNH endonuclease n=1 Tax=viral metagenome TaxID=1070528 RepID=A0A6C0D788_9ZZZZ
MEEHSATTTHRKVIFQILDKKKQRTVVSNKKWGTMLKSKTEYDHKDQYDVISVLEKKTPLEKNPLQECILQELQKKIAGYKTQDIHKGLHDTEKFVNMDDVIHLLCESKMICFYCNTEVHVLYEIVREVNQWTLDRVNNSQGHNRDNVIIACLKCNLNRKTMYHERYAFTRQLTMVKKMDG